jgi:hypothetical protein
LSQWSAIFRAAASKGIKLKTTFAIFPTNELSIFAPSKPGGGQESERQTQ